MITLKQTTIVAALVASAFASTPALADCEGRVPAINAANKDISRAVTTQGTGIVSNITNAAGSILRALGNETESITKNAVAVNKQRGDDAARIAKAQAKQQAAISARNYLEERGLKDGSHGEIVNERGRTVFEVGFARAVRKILG